MKTYCHLRQQLSAMHADFVRRQAEEETYYAQQVPMNFTSKSSYLFVSRK